MLSLLYTLVKSAKSHYLLLSFVCILYIVFLCLFKLFVCVFNFLLPLVVNKRCSIKSTCQLWNSFLKFAFPSIWHMSSKYSTKQHISAQYCAKQMSEIWCKNIHEFLRYSDFRVGIYYFASPCRIRNPYDACRTLTWIHLYRPMRNVTSEST